MKFEASQDLAEKDFLKCPSCNGKNILIKKSLIRCMNCGEKEEADK